MTATAKTLVFRVEMDAAVEAVVARFASAAAKWEQAVFGRWYADYRAHRRSGRGAYAAALSSRVISAAGVGAEGARDKPQANVRGSAPNLYSLFLTRGRRVEPAVPTGGLKNKALHGSLSHLGTAIEGFADVDLRRHRCHDRRVKRRRREAVARRHGNESGPWNPPSFYPRFRPVARFQHDMVRWEVSAGVPTGIRLSQPFIGARGSLRVSIPRSSDPGYARRLSAIAEADASGHRLAVELHHHNDGSDRPGWYAHVAVLSESPDPPAEVSRVVGIDVGERNVATTAVLAGPDPAADRVGAPRLYRGLNTRHRLELQHHRVRRLRRLVDTSLPSAAGALDRARGKQRRVLRTLIHQVSADIVRRATEAGADAVVMEDISRFEPALRRPTRTKRLPGRWGKKMRRLLSRWNRGQLQDAVRYKAAAAGLRVAGPRGTGIYPVYTSLKCPRCGVVDEKARRGHLFRCAQPGCGYVDNDDVTGALNIAARGWAYFHRPGKSPPGRHDPPREPGHASSGTDPPPSSGGDGGASLRPLATTGEVAGPHPQPAENSENGAGVAVPATAGNRLPPTGGDGVEIDTRREARCDNRGSPVGDGASGAEVTAYPDAARKANPRRGSVERSDGASPLRSAPEKGSGGDPLENGVIPRRGNPPAVATGAGP